MFIIGLFSMALIKLTAAQCLNCQKATIHQVARMLATSENVLFPNRNHLLTTGTDDLILWLFFESQQGGYDLEIRHFEKWLA